MTSPGSPGRGGAANHNRVIVTRPAKEALQWVGELARCGLDAVALPLIEIAAVPVAPLQAAWRRLDRYAAVMFVSGNAVEHFFAARPSISAQAAGPVPPRCLATGPGTRSALLQAGVPPALIDWPGQDAAQFDSEALWQVVGPRHWQGTQVLIVRGSRGAAESGGQGDGRDWLARQFVAAGAALDLLVAYERRAPLLDPAQLALLRDAASDRSVWLFSSSEAIAHLPKSDWAGARAVATHPRIAQAAREAGFGVVCESRPALEEVLRSIESLK
jgi:uroporphyrinogen-III synthase